MSKFLKLSIVTIMIFFAAAYGNSKPVATAISNTMSAEIFELPLQGQRPKLAFKMSLSVVKKTNGSYSLTSGSTYAAADSSKGTVNGSIDPLGNGKWSCLFVLYNSRTHQFKNLRALSLTYTSDPDGTTEEWSGEIKQDETGITFNITITHSL